MPVIFNQGDMFETSLDVLYLILSIATATVAIFLTYLLYQAARFVKNANEIVENVTEKLELINNAVQYIQQKMDKVSDNMGIIGKIVSSFVENFVMKKIGSTMDIDLDKRKKTKKKKTTE